MSYAAHDELAPVQSGMAEMHDSPALIVRLAQSRTESTRLVDWFRGAGLGGEGQISQGLLRRALAAVGVHAPTLGAMVAECFRALDPEQTGTIGFSEFHAELRRMRKVLNAGDAYAQPPSRPTSALQRGRSAPAQRPRSGGMTHPDGSAYSALDLENAAALYRRQGELGHALRALEAALAIHVRVHGERSDVVVDCSRRVADVCNSLGMQMLQRDDFLGCHALLRRAQARGQGDRAMLAITLNNLACYHRRRGHLKVALAHLAKAVEIEARCDGAHKPADTHLNMCAVQSELGNHHEAMCAAQRGGGGGGGGGGGSSSAAARKSSTAAAPPQHCGSTRACRRAHNYILLAQRSLPHAVHAPPPYVTAIRPPRACRGL